MRWSMLPIALIALLAALAVAGCVTADRDAPAVGATGGATGGADVPAPSSCGGSHAWPPLDYGGRPLPAGVAIVPTAASAVRVLNGSTAAWRFETAVWVDASCAGYVAETPIRSGIIAPGHLVENEIGPLDAPPPGSGPPRMGVAVFAPACDEACTDPPVGFGWIDLHPTPANE